MVGGLDYMQDQPTTTDTRVHNMITREITLESKEYGALQGRKITVRVPETLDDCRALTVNGDSDVVARFEESIVRAQNNLARTAAAGILKKETDADKAHAALQAKINDYRYAERGEGTSAPKGPKTAKGKQDKAAATSGNRLFEKCLADETFLGRMIKQGIVDQGEFDAWKAAKAEAETAAAAAKTETK